MRALAMFFQRPAGARLLRVDMNRCYVAHALTGRAYHPGVRKSVYRNGLFVIFWSALVVSVAGAESRAGFGSNSPRAALDVKGFQITEPNFPARKFRDIVVGAEAFLPPFSEAVDGHRAQGFALELFTGIAKDLNLEFTTVVASRSELMAQLSSGKIDVILALAATPNREEHFDFSVPYAAIRHAIFVRRGEGGAVNAAFEDKTFIVVGGSITEDFAQGKPWATHLVSVDNDMQALLLLASGKHNAVITQRISGLIALEKLKIHNVEIAPYELKGDRVPVRFAVRKGNYELLSDINESLSAMKANGSYTAIYEKWLGVYDERSGISLKQLAGYLVSAGAILLFAFGAYLQVQSREKRRQLQLILDSITAVVWYLDTNGHVVLQNERASEITGRSSQEARGKTLSILLPGWDDPQRREEQSMQSLRLGILVQGSVESMLVGTALRWYNVDRIPMRNTHKVVDGLLLVAHDITQAKRSEAELRAAEERLQQIIGNIREVFWLYDLASKEFSYFSQSVTAIWGLPANTNPDIGAFIRSIHPEDRDRVLAHMPDARHGRRELAFRIIIADGSIRWIRDRAFPVADESGTVVRIAGVSEDVTERKEIERALRESRERFRQLEENIDAIFSVSDMKTGELVYLSAGHEKIWQRNLAGRLPSRNELLEMIHSDDRTYVDSVKKSETMAGPYTLEYRVVRPDSSWRWIREKGFPARDADGAVTHVAAIAEDVTHSKEIDRQLRRFEAAIAAVPVGIVFTDPTQPNNPLVYVNEGFERTTGYISSEAVGRNCSFLQGSATNPAAIREMRQAIAVGRSCHVTLENYRKDGALFWNSVSITPLRDQAGTIVNFVGIQVDVTVQIEGQTKLQALNTELSSKAEDLAEINKELETFVYSVSHDLRAPARHISGFASLLLERSGKYLDETAHAHLAVIINAAKRMAQLLDDLLTFSRMGRVELRKSQVSLDDIVKAVIRALEPASASRPITWMIKPLPIVLADQNLIYQALYNLIENAVKYSRYKDTPRIDIGTAYAKPGSVVVYVKDNGAGFDMKYADKLFKVFERLHRSDEFEGTGIGLASVARILYRHGGRVWAEAKIDSGAIFYIELPK